MKRTAPWNDKDESSSDESSSSSSSSDTDGDKTKAKEKKSKGKPAKRKSGAAIDFNALRKHGYKGGLSVLNVPPPKEETPQDWTWSTGKEHRQNKDVEESYNQRQETRSKLREGELLANVQTSKEKKNLSFAQKEKKKRDLGQASRGKNYVEEEKRLLRESGIYSSFDS